MTTTVFINQHAENTGSSSHDENGRRFMDNQNVLLSDHEHSDLPDHELSSHGIIRFYTTM